MIRLTTADWQFVASADDTPGLFTDGYLTAVLPEDGEYVLELCDSRFAGHGAGRLSLAGRRGSIRGRGVSARCGARAEHCARAARRDPLGRSPLRLAAPSDPLLATFSPAIPARLLDDPSWADSDLDVELPAPVPLGQTLAVVEPGDPAEKLPPLSPPLTILGRLSKSSERDEFTIKAPPGSKHEVRVEAWGLGSALDGQLRIFARDGRLLGETDDGKGVPAVAAEVAVVAARARHQPTRLST